MIFEDALKAMREGKKVKLPDGVYSLSIVGILCFDGNSDRDVRIISTEHMLRNDWEIVE